jgi:hypothetical protein
MTYNEIDTKVDAVVSRIKAMSNYKDTDCQNAYTVGYLSSFIKQICMKSEFAREEIEFLLNKESA